MRSSSTITSATTRLFVDSGGAKLRGAAGNHVVDRIALAAMLAVALSVPAMFHRIPEPAMRSTLAIAAFTLSPYGTLSAQRPELRNFGRPAQAAGC